MEMGKYSHLLERTLTLYCTGKFANRYEALHEAIAEEVRAAASKEDCEKNEKESDDKDD